jgi:hypothetical protein
MASKFHGSQRIKDKIKVMDINFNNSNILNNVESNMKIM